MSGLSVYKGAMAPARACYCSPWVTIKVGGVSLARLCWQSELGVLLWLHHCLPLLCWESLLCLCLNGDNCYLQLCLLGAVRPHSLALAKHTASWIKGTDKCSVSLFEDPDQRTKGSLDLPLEVHLQEMSDWKSSNKTTDSKNNNEGMKKSLQLVSWNTMNQGKPQSNRCVFSDTFYHLVAKTFKIKQNKHSTGYVAWVFGDFFRGNKEREERAFLPL